MLTHVKVLAWLHIIYGLFTACIAILVFGGMLVGSMFSGSMMGMIGGSILGGFLGLFLGARGALSLVAGWGLLTLRPWARVLTIVLGILSLFSFPFGTILGVYTLWVLFSADGAALFEQPRATATY
ncbi:MAG TPA: hypothetical protein VI259_03295 [Gemmatimonadaceae bacterium]